MELVPKYPMRINKYLAHKGIATRRGADALVEEGRVLINGVPATLGSKVEENDQVEVHPDGKQESYQYYAYHKPRGIITHSPQHGEKDIKSTLPDTAEMRSVFPVGRLDKDSSGLIILTNDGRTTDRLLHPDRAHEKEYVVTTAQNLGTDFAEHMSRGVDIGDYVTRPCIVERTGNRSFKIILGEGKKHQIRRMVDAEKNSVNTLERVRVMNIKLGALPPGELRLIEGDELRTFLGSLGLA